MVRARRGRRSRRSSKTSRYYEWYHGALAAGNVAIIQRNHLEIQFDRSFKLIALHYELCSSGGPSQVNVRGYGPVGKTGSITETGVLCVGGLPRKGTLRINGPWFPTDTSGTDTLATVDHICLKGVNEKCSILLSLKMEFLLSPEEVQASCPKSFLTRQIEPQEEGSGPSTSGSTFCTVPC